MEERFYWLAFSVFSGIGPVKFNTLLKTFSSAKNAWESSASDLKVIVGEKLIIKFERFRKKFFIEDYLKKLKEKDVKFITLLDKEYPDLLKKIQRPPFVLFVKGRMLHGTKQNCTQNNTEEKFSVVPRSVLNSSVLSIAVVGTRKITQYGKDVTEIFTRDLVQNNFTIVSGLAMGVDSVAHKTAVEEGGRTIAVLGCGVDLCVPSSNQNLYDKIIEKGGTIISEMPLSTIPTKGSFPARNRIIAGLSLGVLVTEGAEDSGSLITAECALSNGRRVFAVPGPITSSLSKGPFKLISKGAKLVTNAKDVLSELNVKSTTGITSTMGTTGRKLGETKEEELILKLLENETLHFDEIARKINLESSKIGSILSVMEIKGLIKISDGGFYSVITGLSS